MPPVLDTIQQVEDTSPGFSRRQAFRLGAGLAFLDALTRSKPAHADVGSGAGFTQTPGITRWKIGEIEVTAVSDGFSTLPLSVVPRADPVAAGELAYAAYLPPGDIPIAINTYLVKSGGRLALVDTGGGLLLGPKAGVLQTSLKAAGVAPADIDILIITHLHKDHIAGMTLNGKPVFPNATLIVHEKEVAFWGDDANQARAPADQRWWFKLARDSIAPYAKNTMLITKNDQVILPGVTAEELPGHTPGHTGFRISSGSDQLLIWADIIHFPHLQLPEPGWGLSFDVDTNQGIATRRRTFEMTASDRMLVSGMHLNFPGYGHVVANGPTGYAFIPSSWRYDP